MDGSVQVRDERSWLGGVSEAMVQVFRVRARRAWRLGQQGRWSSYRWSLVAIVALFAAITVLRWFIDGSGQAVAMLYVLPIALCGFWFGRRGGLVAAAVGATAFAVLAVIHGRGDLDFTGWAGPVIAMVLVGGLVGYLADLADRREQVNRLQAERNRALEVIRDEQLAALSVSDSIVQQIAAVRWMLESGKTDEAIDVLASTLATGMTQLSRGLRTDQVSFGEDAGDWLFGEVADPKQG